MRDIKPIRDQHAIVGQLRITLAVGALHRGRVCDQAVDPGEQPALQPRKHTPMHELLQPASVHVWIENGSHHGVHANESEGPPLLSEHSLLQILEVFSNLDHRISDNDVAVFHRTLRTIMAAISEFITVDSSLAIPVEPSYFAQYSRASSACLLIGLESAS